MEMQLGTLGISEIIPPLIIPPNEIKTFTTKTIIDQDISILASACQDFGSRGEQLLKNGLKMIENGDRRRVLRPAVLRLEEISLEAPR